MDSAEIILSGARIFTSIAGARPEGQFPRPQDHQIRDDK